MVLHIFLIQTKKSIEKKDDMYVGELRSSFNDVVAKMITGHNLQNKMDDLAM